MELIRLQGVRILKDRVYSLWQIILVKTKKKIKRFNVVK